MELRKGWWEVCSGRNGVVQASEFLCLTDIRCHDAAVSSASGTLCHVYMGKSLPCKRCRCMFINGAVDRMTRGCPRSGMIGGGCTSEWFRPFHWIISGLARRLIGEDIWRENLDSDPADPNCLINRNPSISLLLTATGTVRKKVVVEPRAVVRCHLALFAPCPPTE